MTSATASTLPPTSRAAVIINPISGRGAQGQLLSARVELARTALARAGVQAETHVTTGTGDARRRAAAAVADGVALVVAWGGDGTINEVGSALLATGVPLGIVAAGSGNGLARDLGLPTDPGRALAVAAGAVERTIDAGLLNDEPFFNVGGIGLDAVVAARFAARGPAQRGFGAYLTIGARELWRAEARDYTVRFDGQALTRPAIMITLANSSQFGNGARIAPRARLDDGALDLVVVEAQPLLRIAARVPALFRGTLADGHGIVMRRVRAAEIAAAAPVPFHLDGEPRPPAALVRVATRPGTLRVRVAAS